MARGRLQSFGVKKNTLFPRRVCIQALRLGGECGDFILPFSCRTMLYGRLLPYDFALGNATRAARKTQGLAGETT